MDVTTSFNKKSIIQLECDNFYISSKYMMQWKFMQGIHENMQVIK